MSQSTSNVIYIPPNYINPSDTTSQNAIKNLIIDIQTKKDLLSENYNNKLIDIQNKFYEHRYDDKLLQAELDKEIQNQISNDTIDANNLFLDNTQKMQDIIKLSNEVKQMQTSLMNNVKTYDHIKSLNGQQLTISNIENTNDYRIHINNKCLSTDTNNNYKISTCNNNDFSQRFTINPVIDNNSYTKEYNFNPQLSEIRSYPYNLVKSKLNGLCLEESNGSVFVNKCQSLNGQKWRGMQSKNKQNCQK